VSLNYSRRAVALIHTEQWLVEGIKSCILPRLLADEFSMRTLKALCEISYFVAIRREYYSAELRNIVGECLQVLWDDGALLSHARHNLAHSNLWLPLLFACRNFLSIEYADADIAKIVSLSLSQTKERIPFRDADLFHAADMLDRTGSSGNEMARSLERGCLRKGSTLNTIADSDAYAITHTVFYATDFGRKSWPTYLCDQEQLRKSLLSLAYSKTNISNLDLRGEFALCFYFLKLNSEYKNECAYLQASVNSDGSWSGPVDFTEKLKDEHLHQEQFKFFTDYHTTLVCFEALTQSGTDNQLTHNLDTRLPVVRRVRPDKSLRAIVLAYSKLAAGTFIDHDIIAQCSQESLEETVEFLLNAVLSGANIQQFDISELVRDNTALKEQNFVSNVAILILRLRPNSSHGNEAFKGKHEEITLSSINPVIGYSELIGLIANNDIEKLDSSLLTVLIENSVYASLGQGEIRNAVRLAVLGFHVFQCNFAQEIHECISTYDSATVGFGFLTCSSEYSRSISTEMEIASLQFDILRNQTISFRSEA
jgi:hypothetical protein